MRDFTLKAFKLLLTELGKNQYEFKTFVEFMQEKPEKEKIFILRHDVDKKPLRSLRTAELESQLTIKGTYYFRVKKGKLPNEVIERVVGMGHEIGYHYDDLHEAGGNVKKALSLFQKNLTVLRELAPIKTACMHGSPMSSFDNRDMWKESNYKEFGIIGEPYFDIDFYEVMYLTDTGRRWDGDLVSIRDRVVSSKKTEINKEKKIHSTFDLINALKKDQLPNKIMLTIHPQRWTDKLLPWLWELVWQKSKNSVKYFVVKRVDSRQ